MMKKLLITSAAASVFALAIQPAMAQIRVESALEQLSGWTVGVGVDYAQGKYNTNSNDNWTWTIPFLVKYETGPWTFRATIPYVTAHGVNRDVGAAPPGSQLAVSVSPGTQSGLGDTFLSAFYTVLDPKKFAVGVDLGGRVKIVTASKSNDLITTGHSDFSIQADLYQGFDKYTVFGTVGWTSKGNINFIDRDITLPSGALNPTFGVTLTQESKDPWYFAIGGSYKVAPQTTLGASYDYRQKVTDTGSVISEATLFLTQKFSKELKLQPYGVVGFSHGSPDWGLGAVMSYGF
jgi:opacity protein-like surface antigen